MIALGSLTAGKPPKAPILKTPKTPGIQAQPGLLSNTTIALPQPAPPNPPPVPSPNVPGFQPFGGTPPTPTPYGDFTAPDPTQVANDPYYQFRLAEGLKQQQRGAAARGTLLSGGFQKALMGYGQGLASEEAGNAFNRALAGYTTNRDTNAQNFGQLMGSYNAGLEGWKANTGGALDYARFGQDTAYGNYDRAYQQSRDQQGYQQSLNDTNAAQTNLAQAQYADDFARQVEATRRQNAAVSAIPGPAPTTRYPVHRPKTMGGR